MVSEGSIVGAAVITFFTFLVIVIFTAYWSDEHCWHRFGAWEDVPERPLMQQRVCARCNKLVMRNVAS